MTSRLQERAILLVLALIALSLLAYQLHFPPQRYSDEMYHVNNARALIMGRGYNDVHPPLGKELIALSILVFGDRPWGWRYSSMLFGVGVLLLLYAIPTALFKRRSIGLLAYFLGLCDGLCFTQARIALFSSFCAFFMLLSVFFLIQYYPLQRWSRRKAFFASGAAFGAMLATKWAALFHLPFLGIWLALAFFQAKDKLRYFLDAFLGFVILPLAIYIISYLPVAAMFAQGFLNQLKYIFSDQLRMWNFHSRLKSFHRYQSQWWQWIFLIRPIWYYYKEGIANLIRGIIALGNPAIFALIIPSFFYGLYRIIFNKQRNNLERIYCFIAAGGFAFQYLPWAIQPRTVLFFHYFYLPLLFAILAEAFLFSALWKWHRAGKVLVIIALLGIITLFIYFFPLLNGLPISVSAFRHRMWLKSWI